MKTNRTRLLAFLLLLVMLAGALPSGIADGTAIVGEVTVILRTSVNLRSGGSTDYPIIGTAGPGDLFQTTGQTSTGWYEILMPDGSFAFISDSLVYFYPYAVSLPIGGQYAVTVYYRNTQGVTLRTVQAPVRVGQNVVSADDGQVPGYRLISTRDVYVNVDTSGRTTPSGIVFTYETASQPTAQALGAFIPIYYRDVYNRVLSSEIRTLTPGAHLVRADLSRVPAGYSVSGASDAVVIVSYTGAASPSAVNFILSQSIMATPRPTGSALSISYRDEAGNVLFNTIQTVNPGYVTITANDSLVPAGMTLTSSRSVVVYISEQGISYPNGVIFTYRAAAQANIQIIYRDLSGRTLYTETRPLGQGSHTIVADDRKVSSGMVLQSARNVQVTVYSGGYALPNQVVFTYAQPVSATISVIYRDTAGANLYTDSRTLSTGTHTVAADDSRVPRNYILQSSRNVQVTVYSNGSASQYQIVFTYARPVSANLSIIYRDSSGVNLFTETRTLAQGSHTITANDGRAPSGYSLITPRNVQVTVYSNGSISPNEVTFIYAPPGPPVTVNVPVYYKDENANIIRSDNVSVSSNEPKVVKAYSEYDPEGYVLISAREVTVTVSRSGVATPSQVVFTFRAPSGPPITINVPVYYKDERGNILKSSSVSVSSNEPKVVKAYSEYDPEGYVLVSAREVTVTVSRSGVATPDKVIFTYRAPGAVSDTVPTLPGYKTFSYSGKTIPVYSGPGKNYFRASNNKASLGGGRIRVWGTVGDWAMIGYGLSNNLYRIGYIAKASIPRDLDVPELIFSNKKVTLKSKAPFIDDPIIQPITIFEIAKGKEVTLLAYESFADHWAYIETTRNGKPVRGFINKTHFKAP